MSRIAPVILVALLAVSLAPLGRSTHAAHAAAVSQVALPSLPDPVAVTVPAASTTFLALDMRDPACANRPACAASLPAEQAGIAAARSAGVPVVYTTVGGMAIDPSLAPMPGDAVLQTTGADKFAQGALGDVLQGLGTKTVVITGTSANGAVLYTAYAAATRGYTVVVAEDGISSDTDFATFLTEWQLLNGPGTSNPQNTPLQPMAVTLSRMDLITYTGTTNAVAPK